MFAITASKNKLTIKEKAILTSGSSNVFDVHFIFSDEWDNLERIAVFRVGSLVLSVSLKDAHCCKLPWECTQAEYIGQSVYAGVYGQNGDTIILPTIWCCLGTVVAGAKLGEKALPKTPTLAEQLLAQVVAEREATEQIKEETQKIIDNATLIAAEVNESGHLILHSSGSGVAFI